MSNTDSEFVARQVTIHDGRLLVVVVDSDILGQEYTEGKRVLDMTNSFFQGDAILKEDLIALMKSAHLLNITGNKSCALALEINVITEDNIITVSEISHAEVGIYSL